MISVAGRKANTVVRTCNSKQEAEVLAKEMISEGYQNVTIDGALFVDGVRRLMSVLENLDMKAVGDQPFKTHLITELSNGRWNDHWGDLNDLIDESIERKLIVKEDNGMGSYTIQRIAKEIPSR